MSKFKRDHVYPRFRASSADLANDADRIRERAYKLLQAAEALELEVEIKHVPFNDGVPTGRTRAQIAVRPKRMPEGS